jgi:hypothetical protein
MPTIARATNIFIVCSTFMLLERNLCFAQSFNYLFAKHLQANMLQQELISYLKEFETTNDTAALMLGMQYFSEKKFNQAQQVLNKVNAISPVYGKAFYFGLLSAICLNKPVQKINWFLVNNDTLLSNILCDFFNAGIALTHFDTLMAKATIQKYQKIYAAEQPVKIYQMVIAKIGSNKQKNKWLAATLSAVVPGSGKWYAGYPLEGLSAFIQISALGGIFAENLIKSGSLTSSRSIAFGSIFALFHAGNIYATYYTVNKKQQLVKKKIHEDVTTSLHMLLRSVYRD